MFIFKIFLMSLLVAMFLNGYMRVSDSLEAIKRFKVISLKNSIGHDKQLGGITNSVFPINIIALIFAPFVLFTRSPSVSDFSLKIQYVVMILFYLALTPFFLVFLLPLTYLKLCVNAIYIMNNNNRELYRGQNVIILVLSFILGPLFVVLSMLLDIISLPGILLKEPDLLERKYQRDDRMTREQSQIVLTTFEKLFYGKNSK